MVNWIRNKKIASQTFLIYRNTRAMRNRSITYWTKSSFIYYLDKVILMNSLTYSSCWRSFPTIAYFLAGFFSLLLIKHFTKLWNSSPSGISLLNPSSVYSENFIFNMHNKMIYQINWENQEFSISFTIICNFAHLRFVVGRNIRFMIKKNKQMGYHIINVGNVIQSVRKCYKRNLLQTCRYFETNHYLFHIHLYIIVQNILWFLVESFFFF